MRLRVLTPTNPDMIAEAELPAGEVVTLLDEDLLLDDAEIGQTVTVEGAAVVKKFELRPEAKPSISTDVEEARMEIVGEIREAEGRTSILVETDAGEVELELEELPENKNGLEGENARVLADHIIALRLEEGDWDA